jgi:hypothetical protein
MTAHLDIERRIADTVKAYLESVLEAPTHLVVAFYDPRSVPDGADDGHRVIVTDPSFKMDDGQRYNGMAEFSVSVKTVWSEGEVEAVTALHWDTVRAVRAILWADSFMEGINALTGANIGFDFVSPEREGSNSVNDYCMFNETKLQVHFFTKES